MMLFELSFGWTLALNIGLWPLLHLLIPFLLTQPEVRRFSPAGWLHRPRRWEQDGHIYERLLAVNRWKKRLPDGARLFKKGFSKKRFTSRSPSYLRRFVLETCRSETIHWLVLASSAIFLLFNGPVASAVMIAYGALANIPLIIVQRYNRFRLIRKLDAMQRPEARDPSLARATGASRMRPPPNSSPTPAEGV